MDKRTATDFVKRIEAHREQEQAIWQEMRRRPDYEMHEDKSIESILDERERGRELFQEANASLDAFDWVDDGEGNLVPREDQDEPAWPEISAKLRKMAGSNKKLMAMVEQIDKLQATAVALGVPQITRAELDAEIERLSEPA